MTANMIKGKGFRGALRYNLEKVEKDVAEVLDHSFVDVREKSIMKEIQMIRIMRPNLQKYFYHTSINFPPCEELTNATMVQIGQDYLREAGFTQHQYIMFRHYDASHPHLHILVNRIGYDGKVLSDSNDFAKCEKILRDLEKKYKLTEVMSSNQARKRAVKKDELEMMKRKNAPSHKVALQKIIENILAAKPNLSCSEFVQQLNNRSINVLFNQASTGYVSGISYSYDGITITGSKLGNDFKWTTLKGKLNYNQERDRAIIDYANAQTRSSKPVPNEAISRVNDQLSESPKISKPVSSPKTQIYQHKDNEGKLSLNSPLETVISNLFHAEDHFNIDPENALKIKRKRKRRIIRR
ncbi:relaxase/mobilization nuclease domain-containing protein [Chryseolinea lacunae]|uniref:Relaxase/mobilization nuclease domain-containing protein n=1 Tax=Chryseolinea lacunae TaxID=2801331 RepID=A0ABS1L433_9BACT|nr:relaxase/mobilization nuclease domain-containing protein [Chryseolinea lacunae]MBL0745702.1 relaxase/mobilization nuclease domain-containing protein [Chryseolinea lacunae]